MQIAGGPQNRSPRTVRLRSLLTYVQGEIQGFNLKEVVGILYAMGYETKRTKGVRYWIGPMLRYDHSELWMRAAALVRRHYE